MATLYRGRGRFVWVGLIAALVVSGCAPDDPQRTEPPPSGSERPRVETPEDRDEKAVLATLRRLELCAVLQSAAGTPGEPSADDPFSCGIDGASVGISQLGTDDRLKLPLRVTGNAKSYVDNTAPNTCRTHFPVSFELVVTFELSGEKGCGPAADRFLAAAATTLTEPTAALAPEPRWDACGALAEALGDDADPRELMWAGARVGPACERWEPSLAHLTLGYRNPLTGTTTADTVGGVEVEVQEEDSTGRTLCWMSWRAGAADSPHAVEPDLWAGVAAQDCGQAKELAGSVMTVLGSPPPAVAPRKPLLYGADEPDSPYPGACAHLERDVAKHCRPYAEVSVPDGTAEVLRAAESDPNTQCATARAAVTEHFGAGLTPVAVDDGAATSCYFAEAERRLQVQFQIGSAPVNGVPEVFTVRETTVAELPAYVEKDQQVYRVWVGLAADPAAAGRLSLTVGAGPAARGAGSPADAATKAERALTDILDEHFS